jgi:predicted HTH transcriptional regulator
MTAKPSKLETLEDWSLLREALLNTLIHADYTVRASVLVVKQPSGFVFRNPGMMRVPVAQALAGGASDCRNRTLHQMFLFINLGERAGSGLPKIRSGWEDMGHALSLSDSFDPYEQTRLEMTWGQSFTGVLTKTPVKTLVKTPDQILGAMRGNAEITVQELAALLGKSESAINRAIKKLRITDKIRRVGGDKGGKWEVLL